MKLLYFFIKEKNCIKKIEKCIKKIQYLISTIFKFNFFPKYFPSMGFDTFS